MTTRTQQILELLNDEWPDSESRGQLGLLLGEYAGEIDREGTRFLNDLAVYPQSPRAGCRTDSALAARPDDELQAVVLSGTQEILRKRPDGWGWEEAGYVQQWLVIPQVDHSTLPAYVTDEGLTLLDLYPPTTTFCDNSGIFHFTELAEALEWAENLRSTLGEHGIELVTYVGLDEYDPRDQEEEDEPPPPAEAAAQPARAAVARPEGWRGGDTPAARAATAPIPHAGEPERTRHGHRRTREPTRRAGAIPGPGWLVYALAVMVLMAAITVGTNREAAAQEEAGDVSYDAAELEMVELINDYRADHGLEPVLVSDTASLAAKRHSEDMATYDFFDHHTMESSYFPRGAYVSDRMDASGYDHNVNRSENIAAGREDASATLQQWIESPGHNENMLTAEWDVVGIGLDSDSSSTYTYYWTTNFGAHADETAREVGELSGGTPSTSEPGESAPITSEPAPEPEGEPGSEDGSSPNSDSSGDIAIEESFEGSSMEAIEELKDRVRQQGPMMDQVQDRGSDDEQIPEAERTPEADETPDTGNRETETTSGNDAGSDSTGGNDTSDDSTDIERQVEQQTSGESGEEAGERGTEDGEEAEQKARSIIERVMDNSAMDFTSNFSSMFANEDGEQADEIAEGENGREAGEASDETSNDDATTNEDGTDDSQEPQQTAGEDPDWNGDNGASEPNGRSADAEQYQEPEESGDHARAGEEQYEEPEESGDHARAGGEDEPTERESQGQAEREGEADATATIARVIDGDTVELEEPVEGEDTVRLIGVDTPETVHPEKEPEPYGEEASQFATEALEGEEVELEFDEELIDPYDRLLAYIWIPAGMEEEHDESTEEAGQTATDELFNETLIREGYGEVLIIEPNDRYADVFEEAEAEAREEERGLWGLDESADPEGTDPEANAPDDPFAGEMNEEELPEEMPEEVPEEEIIEEVPEEDIVEEVPEEETVEEEPMEGDSAGEPATREDCGSVLDGFDKSPIEDDDFGDDLRNRIQEKVDCQLQNAGIDRDSDRGSEGASDYASDYDSDSANDTEEDTE